VWLIVQCGLVAFGSAVGGLLRWGITTASGRWLGTRLPYGTFFINISGCLFLGWFATLLADRLLAQSLSWLSEDDLRLLVAVGFTGGYTTFSTFEYESNALLSRGDGFAGMTYVFGSVFLGLLAVRLGVLLARWR
jgi:CrcB protein